jgi:hypothetical protein
MSPDVLADLLLMSDEDIDRLETVARRHCADASVDQGICFACMRRVLTEQPTALKVYCWVRQVVVVPSASGPRLQILNDDDFRRLKARGMQ